MQASLSLYCESANTIHTAAPIFPWPASPTPTPSTSSTAPDSSEHASTSTHSIVHKPKPFSSTDAAVAPTGDSPFHAPPASSSLWASLLDAPAVPSGPSPAALVPLSRAPHTHAAQAHWKRRGEGIHPGSGFFTAQPTGFFSGLRANRRGFATSSRAQYNEDDGAAGESGVGDPKRPLAGAALFKDWNDLISSTPAPTLLPDPGGRPGSQHRWEQGRRRAQRQTLTNREKHSFQDMFELLFTAMKQDQQARAGAGLEGDGNGEREPVGLQGAEETGGARAGNNTLFSPGPLSLEDYAFTAPPGLEPAREKPTSVLSTPSDLDRLYGSLTSRSRRLRGEQAVSAQLAEEVDRKSEQMGLCTTDIELLRYALDDIFPAADDPRAAAAYPHLLAGLMRTLRIKYGDPALALAVFAYARGMSVASYAFGCTTPAYNELLRTRWEGFKNLRATLDALEEMSLNGVPCDRETRRVVEGVRREVGNNVSPEAARMISRMEQLVAASLAPGAERKDLPHAASPSAQAMQVDPRNAGYTTRAEPRKAAVGQWSRSGREKTGRIDEWKYSPGEVGDVGPEGAPVGKASFRQQGELAEWKAPEAQDSELGFEELWDKRRRERVAARQAASEQAPYINHVPYIPTQPRKKDTSLSSVVHRGSVFAAPDSPGPGRIELNLGKGVVARPLPERERPKFPLRSMWEEQGEYDLPEGDEVPVGVEPVRGEALEAAGQKV
ncbi:hypothetical protein CALVIDRAFT_566771 [Calocera viscosa TUFC12733]|uniref:Mtf2-like C-terminal domain-containing protein n=1 Tax=Calocera viscosa (strain TUFC12733) TaxID=1330018 RepID=A0A167IWW0_CALVF|nr:hypothetical protein CALVIDRAFT_566771 [Calocera viscosa TUFC12733]